MNDEDKSPPRIGVFVCHCGKNIGGVVDVPAVVEHVKKLPDVVFATENLYTCAEDGLTCIKEEGSILTFSSSSTSETSVLGFT